MRQFIGVFFAATFGITSTAIADISQIQADVDARMGAGSKQLAKSRPQDPAFDVSASGDKANTFGERIVQEVDRHFAPDAVWFKGFFANTFKTPDSNASHSVSLVSHPTCESSEADLTSLLSRSNAMTSDERQLLFNFEKRLNSARSAYQSNANDTALQETYVGLMSCLAYTESLGDPDTNRSKKVWTDYVSASDAKPLGVKAYYDTGHTNPASRLNLGLYQFVLDKGGNIQPCLGAYRQLAQPGSDQIDDLNERGMADLVASPGQRFNAFCGVNKIVQTYYVQVWTENARRTHPSNVLADGSLKKPADRCVTLHHKSAYRHFGPLTRSVSARNGRPSNLEKLLSCTAAVLD